MQPNSVVVLDRDWSDYRKGQVFVVVAAIPCGEIPQADGTTITPTNLRVVFEKDDPKNRIAHRTIPGEYAAELPEINSALDVEANQGVRDGTVVAISGSQFLVEYEMPAGRTYGRIFDVLRPGWFRSVPMNNLPAKWQAELAA